MATPEGPHSPNPINPTNPSNPPSPTANPARSRLLRPAPVIIVGSVMFSFISYWKTAAVVLCDLASTAYYIGGIVEQAIGPAAPWFILAVMLFSYAVRWVYIESCSLFIRGGVYRVVREALGSFFAKLAVSALMFDYLLTGPISGVTAGQYVVGLLIESLSVIDPALTLTEETKEPLKRFGSVVIACAITLYFFRQNLLGIHESSDKAFKIMQLTTVMAVVIMLWSGATLLLKGPENAVPFFPRLHKELVLDQEGAPVPKMNPVTGRQEDPLGYIDQVFPSVAERLRNVTDWASWIGLLGLIVAFGHSILAMSGEETLAQVYREIESPKLPNLKKAAFVVFVYSVLLTGGISFLAVLLIPDKDRIALYGDNLISGLAMSMVGPTSAKLLLNAFVVCVGFLILAGAVNTAIIGSNGVLNRVAEDGVMPDWFRKPHPRYGTTSRVLYLILLLQLFIIIVSQGQVLILGEAYAFGVLWSFVFQALAMLVLRFKDPREREYKVPFNIRLGSVEIPVGLGLILAVLLSTACVNFLTKEVATISGLVFTGVFFLIFFFSELYHDRHRGGDRHEHLEKFNRESAAEISPASLGLSRTYRKLVAIRSPQNLYMLEKTLAETDPETTDVVVMTAKVLPAGETISNGTELDIYDQQLMTAVVDRAEKAGKEVKSIIVPTNNPLFAVINTAKDLDAQEVVMGASNKYTADEQLDQIAFYWINRCGGEAAPLTVRRLGRDRDVHFDLGGGNRIPKISERQARSVAELRAAGVGVDRVLLLHDNTSLSSDLFQAVLTMLDPQVVLGLFPVAPAVDANHSALHQDAERAQKLGRELTVHEVKSGALIDEVLQTVKEDRIDLIILSMYQPQDQPALNIDELTRRATCRIFLAPPLSLPQEPEEQPVA